MLSFADSRQLQDFLHGDKKVGLMLFGKVELQVSNSFF